jgi:hypothetical protein
VMPRLLDDPHHRGHRLVRLPALRQRWADPLKWR